MKGFTHESTHNETKEWYTPPNIFKALCLNFDMDVASPGEAAVPWIPAVRHLTVDHNGLICPWRGRIWLNPPYGSDTRNWLRRFVDHPDGVMLVFSRTDTTWFHDLAVRCNALVFIRGRVQFVRGDGYIGGGCGSGSMLLARGPICAQALRRSGLGYFVDLERSV